MTYRYANMDPNYFIKGLLEQTGQMVQIRKESLEDKPLAKKIFNLVEKTIGHYSEEPERYRLSLNELIEESPQAEYLFNSELGKELLPYIGVLGPVELLHFISKVEDMEDPEQWKSIFK